MKKLVLIVGLIFVAASCQKENIVPNGHMSSGSTEKSAMSASGDDTSRPTSTGSNPQSINDDGSAGTETDPSTTSEDDGTITDPMKKKDKKDNK